MRRAFSIALLILFASMTRAAVAGCNMSAPTTMAFGVYTGTQYDTTSSITVKCSWFANYSISLSAGGSGSVTGRAMSGSSAPVLGYQLFSDSGRTANWANNAPGQTCSNFTGCTFQVTVYGRVAAKQPIVPGSFTDTITGTSSGSPSVSIPISASFVASCQIATTGNLAFGNYTGAQLDSTASVSVTCTNKTGYYVNMDNGQHQDGDFYPRMSGPGGTLMSYRLYQNAAHTVEWRDTYNLDGQSGIGNGTAQNLIVYGSIAPNQIVPPGSYSDVIVAAVTY